MEFRKNLFVETSSLWNFKKLQRNFNYHFSYYEISYDELQLIKLSNIQQQNHTQFQPFLYEDCEQQTIAGFCLCVNYTVCRVGRSTPHTEQPHLRKQAKKKVSSFKVTRYNSSRVLSEHLWTYEGNYKKIVKGFKRQPFQNKQIFILV